MAAGVLIAREAGGQVTDYAGMRFDVKQSGGLLASNGLLHAEAIRVFDSVRRSV
jgi:fructose-1,6-bisphosphatase/inositol monophosphatase family enzyme